MSYHDITTCHDIYRYIMAPLISNIDLLEYHLILKLVLRTYWECLVGIKFGEFGK